MPRQTMQTQIRVFPVCKLRKQKEKGQILEPFTLSKDFIYRTLQQNLLEPKLIKVIFLKKSTDDNQIMKNFPACKELIQSTLNSTQEMEMHFLTWKLKDIPTRRTVQEMTYNMPTQISSRHLLVVLSYYFTKFHDFSMIIQVFPNSMIFPCMELFSDFPGFQ